MQINKVQSCSWRQKKEKEKRSLPSEQGVFKKEGERESTLMEHGKEDANYILLGNVCARTRCFFTTAEEKSIGILNEVGNDDGG